MGLASLALSGPLGAQPVHYFYGGDRVPSADPYAAWFTTVGPGHPTGSYFVGTSWSSDGSVLTMETRNPADYSGASSLGIWFGVTDGYGDPSSGIGFDTTGNGNRVELRAALGLNSSEWSLYWFDRSQYEAAFYFLSTGFHIYTAASDIFVPLDSMTSFHDYASHILDGQVYYYLDGALLASGPAVRGGLSSWLLIGDGSATDVSGYGTMRIDSMDIVASAGAAPLSVPVPATYGLLMLGGLALRRGARCGRSGQARYRGAGTDASMP